MKKRYTFKILFTHNSKKILLSLLCLSTLSSLSLHAQRIGNQTPSNSSPRPLLRGLFDTNQSENRGSASIIQKHLSSLSQKERLSSSDTEYFITSEHVSRTSGIHHIYYRQAINGVEILGTEASLHISSNGEVFKSNDRFLLKNISSRVKSSANNLNATQAVQNIVDRMNYGSTSNLKSPTKILPSGYTVFTDYSIASAEILAKKAYLLDANNNIQLVWEVIFPEKTSSSAWNYKIHAGTGEILDKIDLTVSCNILGDHDHNAHNDYSEETCDDSLILSNNTTNTRSLVEENFIMDGSYNVYALPLESPFYGNRTLVVNPADATASPFGWHDTDGVAGAEFTTTRGNNTHTYDDIANNNDLPGDPDPSNDTPGSSPDGGASLVFDYSFDLTVADTDSGFTVPRFNTSNRSLDAASTNTFYWTNIIHDITYQYGFDEASGNFQENNYGNDGVGGDSVNAETQDGGGDCNANFFTLPDGSNARMQMYVCNNFSNPGFDGAYDNLVIAHEYAHGISIRLTGGSANTSSLNNTEQMGEGWSDFYGYMLTMSSSNFNQDRAVGTFLFGGSTLGGVNGDGIRQFPYTADGDVSGDNTLTHQSITGFSPANGPHQWGTVWGTFLYDLAQSLMDEYGFDPDLYTGTGGNNIALNLVTEGLKLQPSSPGFVDGRDAILAADQALYGGANQCLIWEVFANRGLGFSALQGSSNSLTDNTNAFDVPPITLNISQTDFCLANGTVSLGGGVVNGGSYSGPGVTDNGDGSTFTFDPNIAGVGVHTITYQATDCNGLVASDTDTITVTEVLPELSACQDTTISLGADGTATYNPFAPDTATVVGGNNGSNSAGFSVLAVQVTEDVTVTFDWSFTTTDDPGFDDPGYIVDDTFIPLTGSSGNQTVVLTAGQLFGFGTATDDNGFGNATTTFTNFSPGYSGQFAAFNWEEILQNSDGSATFSGAAASLVSSCGENSVTLSKEVFTCLDAGSTVPVTITVTDSQGNTDSCTANVTIDGGALGTSTFSGGSWDNIPTATSVAVIQDNYDTENDGDINACSCTIESNNTVTIRDGDFLNVAGNITVEANGTLIVENSGSVVQIDENAITTNNGTIEVRKTTPSLAPRDFILLSSPMTAETRNGVYLNANRVFEMIPSLFTPNPDVTAAINFIDSDFDYFGLITDVTVGQGILVFPQAVTASSNVIFDHTYTQGTLNSGTIEYNVTYNGPATENNPNILGNPYASAIDGNAVITNNAAINELFYWEHLTEPSPDNPGGNTDNISMDDVSIYNLTGGVAAINGGTAPGRYIPSGQGFAILADQTASGLPVTFTNAMRVTDNNGTVRANENLENKLWLKISDEKGIITNTTLIGFLEEATSSFDKGYDSGRLDTKLSIFSTLENGQELSIQGRETFDSAMKVNLGFATILEDLKTYTITIDQIEGVQLENSEVYLKDHLKGQVTNLKKESYSFTASKTEQSDRFTVFFEPEANSIENDTTINSELILYPNPSHGLITLSYIGEEQFDKAIITDLNGKIIKEVDLSNFNESIDIDLSRFSSGLYFMQISTSNTLITKKILIN